MKEFVHRLRRKPQHVRERMLFLTLAVVMVLVITFWFGVLFDRIGSTTSKRASSSAFRPFSLIRGGIKSSYNSLFGPTTAPATVTETPAPAQTQ